MKKQKKKKKNEKKPGLAGQKKKRFENVKLFSRKTQDPNRTCPEIVTRTKKEKQIKPKTKGGDLEAPK